MNQIERIQYMEEILDQATKLLHNFETLLDEYEQMLPKLMELVQYYESDQWKKDFIADENGILPNDLKRGVLSEDGIYNLLDLHNELVDKMKMIIKTRESNE
ncbi:MAG: DUF4298 domain-containing protein [Bacilli bacterium]|nr:DUF4298 domain-containing protein [Bacilli bacterium]